MTTAELERIARDVVPPVGTTGWRLTVLANSPTGYAVVPILFGRLDGAPVYRGAQRDCHRFHDLLEGRIPTPRRAHDIPAGTKGDSGGAEPDLALAEAPELGGASIRLCAGCDQPLPADARPNQRTHDDACRVAAWRRRTGGGRRRAAAPQGRADADSGVTVSIPDRRSTADPASRSRSEAEPALTSAGIAESDPQAESEASALLGDASGPPAAADATQQPPLPDAVRSSTDRRVPMPERAPDQLALPMPPIGAP